MNMKKKLFECRDDKDIDAVIGDSEEISEAEFEQRFKEGLVNRIQKWADRKKNEEIKSKAREKIQQEIIAEYFPDGLPKDLPYGIVSDLGMADEFENVKDAPFDCFKLSDEEIKALQNQLIKLMARQSDILSIFLSKAEYDNMNERKLLGSFVDEYLKLESIKYNFLDRLQAAYLGHWIDYDLFKPEFSKRR